MDSLSQTMASARELHYGDALALTGLLVPLSQRRKKEKRKREKTGVKNGF